MTNQEDLAFMYQQWAETRIDRLEKLRRQSERLRPLIYMGRMCLSLLALSGLYLAVRMMELYKLIDVSSSSQFWIGDGPLVICAVIASWQFGMSIFRLMVDELIQDLFHITANDLDVAQSNSDTSATRVELDIFNKAATKVSAVSVKNHLLVIFTLIGAVLVLVISALLMTV